MTGGLTIVVLGWTFYRAITLRLPDSFLGVLVGVLLVAQFWYVRAFPLAVQDRVIRLEERLRLAKKVIDERISSRATIKSLIVNWRADHMRA